MINDLSFSYIGLTYINNGSSYFYIIFYKLIYACLTKIASSIIINYFFYSILLDITG